MATGFRVIHFPNICGVTKLLSRAFSTRYKIGAKDAYQMAKDDRKKQNDYGEVKGAQWLFPKPLGRATKLDTLPGPRRTSLEFYLQGRSRNCSRRRRKRLS
jgi:hypothetical protein